MTTDKKFTTQNNTKYWCFTWDTNISQKKLPPVADLINFLNNISETAIFQEECGTIKGKVHYQGTLTLIGPRQSKISVLRLFERRFKGVSGLTLSRSYSNQASEDYVTKDEGRISGPYFCGKKEKFSMEYSTTKLTAWQQDLFDFLTKATKIKYFRDRIVIVVQDEKGNSGKSFFLKWLAIGQKVLNSKKLPVTSVDRLMSAVTKVTADSKRIDLFTINLTRSKGEDQSYKDLFAAIEEIKDGYIVDAMYGNYKEAIFDPPIVVIFTNLIIDGKLSESLSPDRWLKLTIDNKKNIVYNGIAWNAYITETPLKDIEPEEFAKNLSTKYLGEK
ncbi:replication associated protein [Lake Sarah-associated circular molecule 10]|uniref:replication associated protein n=1 Tax=Lake Sarah-associated circular molecule 10 TaxID=1685725 RepID=UPI0007773CBD|nr:replication associated protein [Lake Sarah-associated circular molecule 10]ALE29557.1 replication associated protein [Lake Sarah-associated circular molecule 10]ALE29558.1 replication associated protein [Lake Sarah-associated circular molecule 10]ALE29559.1 replication associated protein [Lake Sarah-associated circular molecule 10]ALE29560.1 replication associated protein [Lake Sarah-associated circular molecule 10]ALE29561.1 replication associated protein [Lake Sarah-associated circular mo